MADVRSFYSVRKDNPFLPHVRVFDITGKAMINWVAVEPEGVVDDDPLNG